MLWWKKVLGIDAAAVANRFVFEHGKLARIDVKEYDDEGKVDALKLILKQFQVKPDEVVYVGHDDNDAWVMKSVGLPVAFLPRNDAVRKLAKIVIEEKDLRKLLPALETFKSD